jgi:hypothetical protein
MQDEYVYTPHRPWTEEEVIFVEENLKTLGITKIAKRLGRSRGSVNAKVQHMKRLRYLDNSYAKRSLQHATWSIFEVDRLKYLISHTDFTFDDIGIQLRRTRSSVYAKVYSLYGTCSRSKIKEMEVI